MTFNASSQMKNLLRCQKEGIDKNPTHIGSKETVWGIKVKILDLR